MMIVQRGKQLRRAGLALVTAASIAVAMQDRTSAKPQTPAGAPATQTPPAGARGGGAGGPTVVSPEVKDSSVTLRLFAPDARQVIAAGELDGKPHPMTKGPDGVWTVTIGPLAPDIYTYAFNVDGISALAPRNPNTKYGYGSFRPVSIVQVPGAGPEFYDVKPVPHGEVRMRPYVSKSLGVSRTVWIYTPPDYEQGKDFPVLHLLHGAGDIESGWTMIGRANVIQTVLDWCWQGRHVDRPGGPGVCQHSQGTWRKAHVRGIGRPSRVDCVAPLPAGCRAASVPVKGEGESLAHDRGFQRDSVIVPLRLFSLYQPSM
jgi:hypothetical protein